MYYTGPFSGLHHRGWGYQPTFGRLCLTDVTHACATFNHRPATRRPARRYEQPCTTRLLRPRAPLCLVSCFDVSDTSRAHQKQSGSASSFSGDSYSSVFFGEDSPQPTKENPIGIKFPGLTYAGDDRANWVRRARRWSGVGGNSTERRLSQVGHLISKYLKSTPVVYDYAVGGKTVDSVFHQVTDRFMIKGPGNPDHPIQWSPETSLFSTGLSPSNGSGVD